MRDVKIKIIYAMILAIFLSVLGLPTMADQDDYTLDRAPFGIGAYTRYSGPVTAEAAIEYLSDVKAAIDATIASNPEYFHVYFYLRNAKVVVVQRPEAKISFGDLVQVLDNFRGRELWVEDVYLVTQAGKRIDMVNANRTNTKGRARFMALRSVRMQQGDVLGTRLDADSSAIAELPVSGGFRVQ